MAKQQQDKEDILREATALVNRIELKVPENSSWEDSVFVGFRRDQSISFFFGGEPVYQFNIRNQFRRGYDRGVLLKAEHGQLVQLRQERENGKLVLLRRVWEETETTEYLESVRMNLAALRDLVRRNLVEIVGAVVEIGTPEELLQQITHWIDQHMDSMEIASVPNVSG